MAKWALIVDGEVVELTDINPTGRFHPSLEWVECGENVGQGWVYDCGNFSAPVVEQVVSIVPQEITAWQGSTILNQSGLYNDVKAFVDAMPDDATGTQAKIDFYRAAVWKRDWGWLNSVAKGAFGMTDAQIDEMFIAASAL